ncbi:MAG TPA: MBL fold metallo-hydrolase [Candidatus Saccharimonadales bacterium]|nr:MBL fold metallo-hydrolase [Candidatus Saccharimonadales bacterium]
MQKIQFFGAVGTVTGSSYFLSDETGKGILVDFGMFQETSEISQRNRDHLPLDPNNILGVVVTHAHLDHCGRLPMLVRMGYFGKVYMTEPTKMIAELALMDAVHIAENNHKEMLYTEENVVQFLRQIEIVEYDQKIDIEQFSITFRDAGHIMGSAMIEIVADNTKTVFSGDLGNTPEELVRPTAVIEQADVVVMESTYGDRIHPQEATNDLIQQEINAVEKSGGTLLVPAFAIDRTQELLHKLNHFKNDGKIAQDTAVFLDSPMGIQATLIYEHFPQLYNDELSNHAKEEQPFRFEGLVMVEHGKESGKIEKIPGTKVIIAGSGMMSGGRILRHAQKYLPDVTTRLLITGYQAEGTIGRKIKEGANRVMIEHESVAMNAHVTALEGLSAHADQPKLLHWIKQIKGVKKLFITHGEDVARTALHEKIKEEMQIESIILPQIDETHEL